MALVKVFWTETKEFEAEIEIDGFEGTNEEAREAIGDLSSEQHDDAYINDGGTEIVSVSTVRAGDEPIKVAVAAKQHEDMF